MVKKRYKVLALGGYTLDVVMDQIIEALHRKCSNKARKLPLLFYNNDFFSRKQSVWLSLVASCCGFFLQLPMKCSF